MKTKEHTTKNGDTLTDKQYDEYRATYQASWERDRYESDEEYRKYKKEQSKKDAILKMQFSMAMNGSVEMLKWLGIQYCGQSNQPSRDESVLPKGFNVRLIK